MFRYSTLDRGNIGGGRAPRPCIAFHNAFEDVHGMTISTSACAECLIFGSIPPRYSRTRCRTYACAHSSTFSLIISTSTRRTTTKCFVLLVLCVSSLLRACVGSGRYVLLKIRLVPLTQIFLSIFKKST